MSDGPKMATEGPRRTDATVRRLEAGACDTTVASVELRSLVSPEPANAKLRNEATMSMINNASSFFGPIRRGSKGHVTRPALRTETHASDTKQTIGVVLTRHHKQMECDASFRRNCAPPRCPWFYALLYRQERSKSFVASLLGMTMQR
jgi:hypothetical protein